MSRYDNLWSKLKSAVLAGPGETPSELRQKLATRARALTLGEPASEVPGAEEVRQLVDRITFDATQVTSEDLAALQRAGWSDDQLFEIITATALGASEARYEVGMRALEEAIR